MQATQMRLIAQQQQQQQQQQQHHQRVRLPRSADPSPQRTARRLESLNELHGGPLSIPFPAMPMGNFPPAELHFSVSDGSHNLGIFPPSFGQPPHHHHQESMQ
jgi:hypothetical protein